MPPPPRKRSTKPAGTRPSIVRAALLASYEKRIGMLEAIADGAPMTIRTHETRTIGGKGASGKSSRKITTKSETITEYTPTLEERMRAMEHLGRYGLGAPNVNLDKDGEDAKPLVIKEAAE